MQKHQFQPCWMYEKLKRELHVPRYYLTVCDHRNYRNDEQSTFQFVVLRIGFHNDLVFMKVSHRSNFQIKNSVTVNVVRCDRTYTTRQPGWGTAQRYPFWQSTNCPKQINKTSAIRHVSPHPILVYIPCIIAHH